MASQNPIHTLSTPKPVKTPRAKPLATTVRSVGYGKSRGLSDHSGRQGKIMSITPSVAHKNTNRSTPTRRNHRRATEGEDLETGTGASGTGVSAGDLSSPTLVVLSAKGSLGSEILGSEIMRASFFVRSWDGCGKGLHPQREVRPHWVHSTTSEPEYARPRRDNRYSTRRRP